MRFKNTFLLPYLPAGSVFCISKLFQAVTHMYVARHSTRVPSVSPNKSSCVQGESCKRGSSPVSVELMFSGPTENALTKLEHISPGYSTATMPASAQALVRAGYPQLQL